ncbi:alpha/beta fold hydrolase [Aquabacterium sp. CECT 9606]|uniref:alpha/beta fold hydrolase n=1 Tax=Aquabacterium sp. CECT 9606 TaxID=2845822 RepID=UPI001E5C0B4D|nr:alpha/beta hydrolase [Aquabacterium sp. CECT 9606]CAH0347819.1 Epoxide hydrolase A [Aquabacterium sp. CECT 9606]
MDITSRRITLPSLDATQPQAWLDCRMAGPEDAPLLVFLHGFPEAAFAWDELLAHFGEHYRCVAPNLRGYPGSYAPPDAKDYRAQLVGADVLGLIRTLGAPATALIAHDWGGAIAWGLAAMAPQMMERLVILNAPHPALFMKALRHDPAQQAASEYMNLLRRPGVEAYLQADDFAKMWSFFERFGRADWLTPELREQYRQAWSAGLSGPLNYYRASPLHPPTAPTDAVMHLTLPEAMLHVNIPTTVIWGEADMALPPSLLDGLEAYVPDLHITRVPQATHWIVHEEPAAVIHALQAALNRSA